MNDSQLQELFHRYGYLVHRRCVALLHNRTDAEDALQDVFLRVGRYGHTYIGKSILGWLYAISFNVCCDHIKRRRREQPEAPETLVKLSTEVVGTAEDGDRRAVVSAALRDAGPCTREMVVLHFLDGLTQEEVAQASGYSRRTVGKKLRAFSERLQRRWNPEGAEP